MIEFGKINFGESDADTEAERSPKDFSEVFFDPNNYLSELLNGYKYIIRGRKGDGKTAYGAKIKLDAESGSYYAWQRYLMNFNNDTFSKIKTYDKFGGNPYISFWKCVLLIEFVCMLNKFEPSNQDEKFNNLVYSLNRTGLITPDNDIVTTISKLVETNTSFEFKSSFGHHRKKGYDEIISGAEGIYTAIFNTINTLFFQKSFYYIIDGLDDILYNDEFKSDIITGLIRATDMINKAFYHKTLNVKIILLIRDDIWNLCRDPNLSKIQRDSSIRLEWALGDDVLNSDLLKLVEKRVMLVTKEKNSLQSLLGQLFTDTIAGKKSLDYILDNIIYRPRDILQFFIEAQKYYKHRRFTEPEIQSVLNSYSTDYFLDALKDELTGFFPNDFVTKLPMILSKMGSRLFYLHEFEEECNKYPEFKMISKRDVLESLFSAGFIGQHRPRTNRDFTVFSYRNHNESFVAEHECILHRGLMRALYI